MTRAIAIGTEVMNTHGNIFTYGGPAEHEGFEQIRFHMRSGERSEIFTDPDRVAPAEVAERVNLKDPRITVVKHDKKPGYWASGPWAASLEGGEPISWHKTKKEGVAEMAARLAIRDWHEEEVKVA